MKIRRVINGKKYDTATATEVATIKSDFIGLEHFKIESTNLYLTKKGTWFIAGVGGALTRWNNGGTGVGHGLELVTPDEAMAFLEDVNGPVEDYFEIEEG